jgi:hypothetical protein
MNQTEETPGPPRADGARPSGAEAAVPESYRMEEIVSGPG